MRLLISRSQANRTSRRGAHEGVEFTLYYQLELTPEEHGIVSHYGLGKHPLTFTTFQGTQIPKETIAQVLAGVTQTVSDLQILRNNEEVIKSACDELPALLAVTQAYGGDEVIEYPRDRQVATPEPADSREPAAAGGGRIDFSRPSAS